jgi:hypothetical protein
MRAPKSRLPEKPRVRSAPVPVLAGGRAIWLACAILAVWAAVLVYARDQVPPGLNNDATQEALRGIRLVEEHHWEVVTASLGNSAETLYLICWARWCMCWGRPRWQCNWPAGRLRWRPFGWSGN